MDDILTQRVRFRHQAVTSQRAKDTVKKGTEPTQVESESSRRIDFRRRCILPPTPCSPPYYSLTRGNAQSIRLLFFGYSTMSFSRIPLTHRIGRGTSSNPSSGKYRGVTRFSPSTPGVLFEALRWPSYDPSMITARKRDLERNEPWRLTYLGRRNPTST